MSVPKKKILIVEERRRSAGQSEADNRNSPARRQRSQEVQGQGVGAYQKVTIQKC